MRNSRKLILILLPAALVLTAGAAYLDHVLSRDDRIAATAAVDLDMVNVRDQILRFENENWRLPRTLDELVPHYVRKDQIYDGDALRYLYDAEQRTFRQVTGCVIRGLWTRTREPAALALPIPEPSIAEQRLTAFNWVFKQVRRYEREHGSLPLTLEKLVPMYLSSDQIVHRDRPLYAYHPEKRLLVQVIDSTDPAGGARIERKIPLVDLTVSAESDLKHGVAVTPRGPKLPAPPTGAIVFEAEHFTEMNWGWEVHPDPSASGGAYLHCWEGMTNGPAQLEHGAFNFWDVHEKRGDYTRLVYHVHVPKSGNYYVLGRMWTTDTHCSNAVNVGVDRDEHEYTSMGNRTPFRWVWSAKSRENSYLRKGDHFISIFIHEDGVRFDQFMLSEEMTYDGKAYRPNYVPGTKTAWRKKKGPSFHVSFDVKSQMISPANPPEVKVVLRRLRETAGEATLRVGLAGALPGGKDIPIAEHRVDLSKLPEVSFVPLSFSNLDLVRMSRREYLLKTELLQDGKVIASNRVTLLRPWVWEACGPFPYYGNHSTGPLDGAGELSKTSKRTWRPVEEKHIDHFGVLDFGLWCGASSLHAPQDKTIYARTRIMVPETGRYLFLIQTDDQMLLWVDGRLIYRFDSDWDLPVTRAARRRRIRLTAGAHELRMRVNQTHTRWQAAVRIRTRDDDLSHVIGLPEPTGEEK